ncbi:histidine kinase [Chitinasiproducens palmae]|uniref:Uncharacterized protein n=1 Tax=Chitinasiproducens palmae TaxID=1770053 RepID=A0A1H2PT05_9BURK|nr:sensor histidine kinase [Chitinasiproducens palmae]SDV50224.1 hypothetical protein SAMN05216551_1115 [Chitinasiproducens palmae]
MELTALGEIFSWIDEVHCLTNNMECTAPRFFRPYHFVLAAMELRRIGAPAVRLPREFEGYAARMHFWDAIGLRAPVYVNEYNAAGRFHPLERLEDEEQVDQVSEALTHILDNGGDTSAKAAVQELLGNCFAHAESDMGLHGLACAQFWARGRKAQIAICDSGIGIRRSLLQRAEYRESLATSNACEFATRYAVTSKPNRGHSGYGLKLARDLMGNNGGCLYIVSYDEFFMTRGAAVLAGQTPRTFNGTLIVLEWNTDVPLSTREVYESWPQIEGNDDDFGF